MSACSKFIRPSCLIAPLLISLLTARVDAVPTLCYGNAAGPDGNLGDPKHLSLEIPARGWLLVAVESPDESATWLDIASPSYGKGNGGSFIDRGLDQGLLAVEPGIVDLRFGAVTSANNDTLRLATHFIPDDALRSKDGEEGDDTEAGNAEIIPFHGGEPDEYRKNVPDKDGEEGDDTEAGNAEIIPLTGGENDDSWWGCLVGEEPFDDFSLCATQLWPGRSVQERLGEQRGLDRDYFAFDLDQTSRVHISTRGTVEMRGTLLLANGRPLAVTIPDLVGESVGGFEIEADLVPGSYLVRVEGIDDVSGDYEIAFQTSSSIDTP